MKAKKVIGTILIVIGVLLVALQFLSILGGGIPVMGGVYGASVLLGFFSPGIVGVILLVIGVKLKGKLRGKKEGTYNE